MDPKRRDLVEHVLRVQSAVRTCEGCGQCCTEAFNSVAILPIEAVRIATHMADWARKNAPPSNAASKTPSSVGVSPSVTQRNYTCPFLEADMTCALPFDVKPVAASRSIP
jgi:Fe-S-cluster containining protein